MSSTTTGIAGPSYDNPRSAAGSVKIDNWSFFGRDDSSHTPFLVGPIVGTVTETTARILVEMAQTTAVTMEAFMDGESVYSVTKQVQGKTPTVFRLEGFAAGRRVLVKVLTEEFEQEREARFTMMSDKTRWKFAAVSCNCHTHTEKLRLWERLGRVIGEVDCVLHLGDQIYADEDIEARDNPDMRFDSAWRACLGIVETLSPDEWATRRDDMLEHYRQTYRRTWNMPVVAKVLASAANYMICDDHEVVDDLGDEPEHSDESSKEFFVIKVAYQAYCEYQRQLFMDMDVEDSSAKAFYAFKISPRIGLFMTDNRVERSIHRSEGTEEEWKHRDFLGPRQWARLTEALEKDFADCDTVLLGVPTPLVLISQAATGMAERVINDARGTWGHRNFKTEQQDMCNLLSNWQSERPNRAVISLAGDVHIGGFTDSWHKGHKVPLHQLTASAVGNVPERNIDAVKRALMRQVMHADQVLFNFKVRHYEWVFGPNYGMVDISLKDEGRPDVTMTLVQTKGKSNIRNLELGDSKVRVHKADHGPASEAAHATAEVMDAPLPPEVNEGPNARP